MRATDPSRLLRSALAVLTGLALATACFAQAPPPPIRLGVPIPAPDTPPPGQPPPLINALPVGPIVPTSPNPPTIGPIVVPGQTPDQRPQKVGEVLIFGNEVTKDRVIRRQIPLQPGQVLSFPDLRLAEQNLAGLGIFVVDPQTGVHPTVAVDPNGDSEFKNILVHVQEARTTSL